MRRRFSSYRIRTPRAKKIRPMVRVKERVAKKGGRCSACKGRYESGDKVTVVNIRRRTYHTAGCVPANVEQSGVSSGPVVGSTPTAVVAALSTTWSPGEAKLVAMQALENALVTVAKKAAVITPEMEAAFDRYNKLKGVALRPGSENEGVMAMREAVIKLVRTIF